MRVLLLNSNLKGIGTYHRAFAFGRELAARGHDVTLMTVSPRSKTRPVGYYLSGLEGPVSLSPGRGTSVRIIEGPRLGYKLLPGWGAGPLDILARTKEVSRGGYDVVYSFEHQPNVSWPVYLTKAFVPYRFYSDWCDWHSGSANQFRGWGVAHKIDSVFEEAIRRIALKVTVVSTLLRDRALSIGIPKERVVKVPQAAATDYVKPYPRDEARRRLSIPQDKLVLVSVTDGDMQRAVRIFSKVAQSEPEAVLLVVGRPAPAGRRLSQDLGIADHCIWSGWVRDEDYPYYLACADVCFTPLEDTLNNRARWPTKILDYLAAGRATVTNDVGEAGAMLSASGVGILTDQDDESFAGALVKLLRDKELRMGLGMSARRLIEQEWDWRVRGEEIAAVVEE